MTIRLSPSPLRRIMQPKSRTIELATGLRYHVLDWESQSDHTVVLVHGFLDMSWGWQPMVDAGLGERFHVVAPDMRGHGDSDRAGPGGYYHFMDYLADLHYVVTQLGRAKVSLVGHSMGGSICSYYAGTYPERVSKLALLEGVGPPELPVNMPKRARSWIESWRRAREQEPRSYASVAEAASRLQAHDRRMEPELAMFLAERGTMATADGRWRFKHDPLHVTRGPYPYQLDLAANFWRGIKCPVLFVEGSESSFRHQPQEAERRYNYFDEKSKRVVIEGAGHMMQRHRPAELSNVLAEFLSSSSRRPMAR